MAHDRRSVMVSAAALAASTISFFPWIAASEIAETVVVDTSTGKLRGAKTPGVSGFLGVPYGIAKRFMPPEPAAPWTGTRDAVAFGPRAPQYIRDGDFPRPAEIARVMDALVRFANEPISEDCQVLNVWTPQADGRKRPVMFWCHGGGFAVGSSQEPDYHGANLARKNDVVVVSPNHRLNAFGYCYLGHAGGPDFASSGNVGMLDLVQALKWVRENISRFGGDPANVTIFGQSGGGAKVSALLAMPAAKGLFHKAIILSGPGVRMTERDRAEESANKLLSGLGLGKTDAAKLQSVPMQDIIKVTGVAMGGGAGINFSPVVDGVVLPAHPWDPKGPDISADIPIIIGHTEDEGGTLNATELLANAMTEAELTQRVQGLVGAERAPQIVATYKQLHPKATPIQLWTNIGTDRGTAKGSITVAERKIAQGRAPVRMYIVGWETPVFGGIFRSPHGLDMPLIFDNVEVARGLLGPGSEPQQIADQMSRAFVAFARTGNPEHRGIPKWPAYTLAKRETLVFNVPARLVNDPVTTQRQLWESA